MSFSGTYELKPAYWTGGIRGKQIYEFQNDVKDPLTYEDADCNLIRPDAHTFTDMGSVPKLCQFLLPKWFAKDRYISAYIFHDDAYNHKGLWFAMAEGWQFIDISRRQADNLLREMVTDLGASKANAYLIWLGVRIGGRFSWGKGESKRKPI